MPGESRHPPSSRPWVRLRSRRPVATAPMLFNSLEFLLFFPVVVGLFYATPHRHRWLLLLVASYAFYMAWEPAYGLLIGLSTTVDYTVARRLHVASRTTVRRAWLMVSLCLNLGLLFSFKYYNLVNDTFASLAAALGFDWPAPRSSLLLPVGISFYTFQTLSYTIDVYRGRHPPEGHFGVFALFVAYFPQLVAGPIERAERLLPQLRAEVRFDPERIGSGLRLAAWGMFKKVVVADRLAEVVDLVYADPQNFGGFGLALATLFFGYQVYYDFSGYSDIAIGLARVLGVDLITNFDQPYLARSPSALWSRWHISMTTWFRDYVYLPLGGSRVSRWRWALNVTVVFVGSGLWHGAKWSLTVWGALHAAILIAERLTAPGRRWLQDAIGLTATPRLQGFVQWGCTWMIWQLTLPFFRADTLTDALYIVSHLGTGWSNLGHPAALAVFLSRVHLDGFLLVYCLLLLPVTEAVDYALRTGSVRSSYRRWPVAMRWGLDYVLVFVVLLLGSFDDTPFIYFQF